MTGSMINNLLREPLLQFCVIGVGLFAVYEWLGDDAERSATDIVVDEARVASLEAQFSRLWQRPPSQEELGGLIDGWIREEMLYREGLTMGLDRDDPIIRRRIAQKVAFISEDLLTVDPSEAELTAWLEQHADDYRIDPRVSFRQILLEAGGEGSPMAAAVADIHRRLARGESAEALGAASLLPPVSLDRSPGEVSRLFGEEFAAVVMDLSPGPWHGPVKSEFGAHLVQITGLKPGRVPGLDAVRAAVARDLVRAKLEESNRQFLAALQQRYRVSFAPDQAVAQTSHPARQNEG